jgi:hypothetical protein
VRVCTGCPTQNMREARSARHDGGELPGADSTPTASGKIVRNECAQYTAHVTRLAASVSRASRSVSFIWLQFADGQ